jgi:hypothetical protein
MVLAIKKWYAPLVSWYHSTGKSASVRYCHSLLRQLPHFRLVLRLWLICALPLTPVVKRWRRDGLFCLGLLLITTGSYCAPLRYVEVQLQLRIGRNQIHHVAGEGCFQIESVQDGTPG